MVVVVVALFWFLQRTRMGKAMRAYSDNEDLALLSGIDPDRVVFWTWVIAAALATIAGTLYGLDKSFKPFTYFQLLLPIFAAAIVGGIGNPLGALVGGCRGAGAGSRCWRSSSPATSRRGRSTIRPPSGSRR